MVQTRSKMAIRSESVDMVEKDEITYDCNVLFRIHKDAVLEIGGKAHKIPPKKKNDFNVRLRLVSGASIPNEDPPNVKLRHQDSPQSNGIQVYEPAARMAPSSVDVAWDRCKFRRNNEKRLYKLNDVVLAKLRGYAAWPAIILKLLPKKRAKVEFFGADPHEKIGYLNLNEIVLYKDCIDVLLIQLKKKIPKYKKAIREAESVCGISDSCSVLNMHNKALTNRK